MKVRAKKFKQLKVTASIPASPQKPRKVLRILGPGTQDTRKAKLGFSSRRPWWI